MQNVSLFCSVEKRDALKRKPAVEGAAGDVSYTNSVYSKSDDEGIAVPVGDLAYGNRIYAADPEGAEGDVSYTNSGYSKSDA